MDRFEQKFIPVPWSGCWIWTEQIDKRTDHLPYGEFWFQGKGVPAHRAAWILYKGVIPEGRIVCHSCDVPYCVNPSHLFIGTHKDNTADMMAKGRHEPMRVTRLGERNNMTKLTAVQAMAIFNAIGNQYEIADAFGVTQGCVSLIKSKKNWKHIHE